MISDPLFSDALGPTAMELTRSNSDVMTRASTLAGAERVPLEEFWTLTELGVCVVALRGRDSEVSALQQRPVCAYRHEYRMEVRLGAKASGKLAQNPLMTLANTPPGIRLSSPRGFIPFLASFRQVGLPAGAASGAQLGRSVYLYQSGEVVFDMCGADTHVLWRAVGQHGGAHGQTGSKTLVT